MNIFLVLLMAVLAVWAILATVLALVWGGHLRRERQEHEDARQRNAQYRAALQRLEKEAAIAAARFEALQREHLALRQAHDASEQALAEQPMPLVMIDSLDLSGEIGTLFEHVARVAAAIRSYSAYTRGHHGREPDKARYDLLWLADCLHTFDRIGKALAAGSQRALSAACAELLEMYAAYPGDGSGYDSRDTFRRLAAQVPLDRVSDAIRTIVMKTGAGVEDVQMV
ncbi:MAG: hypothetical protein J7507_01240 [Pseudoxanthomonas sp.]|nr:hypothetical protein [Pseudoxanthomonas sp.]